MEMNASRVAPRIALGPLTYYWPRERVLAFYDEALKWPVDTVYLGETVCARRHELRLADWLEIAQKAVDAGKEAVVCTYELIENDADLRVMRSVVDNGRFHVEANDMGAVRLLSGRVPFVAGPFLNVYNAATLELLAECGAKRWVPPVELSGAGLREVLANTTAPVETELFAFGRLPLAVSARCFTARYHNLTKDHCAYRCIDDPEGLPLTTQDGEAFLVLNGVQTQSARVHSIMPWLGDALAIGVDALRLSPQPNGMEQVVRTFAAAAHGELAPHAAQERLAGVVTAGFCDGYWHGKPGLQHQEEAS